MSAVADASAALVAWDSCRFLSCSVLPVRVACNCTCRFCFSKSSVSALRHESWVDLPTLAVSLFVTQIGLLFWETRYVSATLAYPGLKPGAED